jgi:plastocyanin
MTNRSTLKLCLGLVVVLALVGCGGAEKAPEPAEEAAAPAPAETAGTAAVTGKVTYADGDPDAAVNMDADPVCEGLHTDPVTTQKVVVDEGGNLANVFVYIKEGLEGRPFAVPAETLLLDQEGCRYSPHVSGIQKGQKLVIRNSDPTLHNVHAMPAKNQEFNQGQPFQGMEIERTFDQAEVMVPFKCDVHPWMASYLGVLEHSFFAVSGTDGSFSIGNLPAGTYVVEGWHEELGSQTQEVTVGEGETVEVSFDFSPA